METVVLCNCMQRAGQDCNAEACLQMVVCTETAIGYVTDQQAHLCLADMQFPKASDRGNMFDMSLCSF